MGPENKTGAFREFRFCISIALQKGKQAKEQNMAGGDHSYSRPTMLAIGILPIPVLIGNIGWLYGTILRYDAIANVSEAYRNRAIAYSEAIIMNPVVIGATITKHGRFSVSLSK
jgi:hypothetical protein